MHGDSEGIPFSVVIPLFNKEDQVRKALDSVLGQDYSPFEIIVVDDGSTDQGAGIVLECTHPCVRLIRQPNQGVSVARNVGVAESRFEHVVFLDADDYWEQGFLKELNRLVHEFPEAGIYGLNYYFIHGDGNSEVDHYPDLFGGAVRGLLPDYFRLFAIRGRSPFCNSSCCYPRRVFLSLGGYKAGVRLTEDSDLWCRIALDHGVAFSRVPLAHYRFQINGNTSSLFLREDFEVVRTLRAALQERSCSRTLRCSIKSLIRLQTVNLVKRAIMSGHRSFATQKILASRLLYQAPGHGLLLLIAATFPLSWISFLKKWGVRLS